MGGLASPRPSRNSWSDPSCTVRLWVMMSRPLRQVTMMVATIKPTSSGSHAPWLIFETLELKKPISTV